MRRAGSKSVRCLATADARTAQAATDGWRARRVGRVAAGRRPLGPPPHWQAAGVLRLSRRHGDGDHDHDQSAGEMVTVAVRVTGPSSDSVRESACHVTRFRVTVTQAGPGSRHRH